MYSTYGVRCGIAAFAATVENLLGDQFAFSICSLDPFLFRSRVPHVAARADALLTADRDAVAAADIVCIQFEPGIFGAEPAHIVRRLQIIVGHALALGRRVVVTNHTVFSSPRDLSLVGALSQPGQTPRWKIALGLFTGRLTLARRLYGLLRRLDERGLLTMIVHNRRDKRYLTDVWGFSDVHDHPLQHLHKGWETQARDRASIMRAEFERRFGAKRFLGTFGFIADYKGFDTAIRAMRHLDDDHVLLVFGAIHPNTVREGEPVNGYLAELIEEIEGTTRDADRAVRRIRALAGRSAEGSNQTDLLGDLEARIRSISDRVAFMGSPDEFEFAASIAACDVCLFPYREVGQSGSGPVSYAVELERPIVATATGAFRELEKYFPERLALIDIGNHLQLAEKIREIVERPKVAEKSLRYTNKSMAELYASQLSR